MVRLALSVRQSTSTIAPPDKTLVTRRLEVLTDTGTRFIDRLFDDMRGHLIFFRAIDQ